MRHWQSLLTGVLALALVAHLWMLDAPAVLDEHRPVESVAVTAGPSAPGMTACSGGMTACRTPMPVEFVLLGLVLLAVAAPSSYVATWSSHPVPWGVDRPERAPPRPAVPASVVLLE